MEDLIGIDFVEAEHLKKQSGDCVQKRFSVVGTSEKNTIYILYHHHIYIYISYIYIHLELF
jgi:hypothetical protein